jgi:hypothetical protein
MYQNTQEIILLWNMKLKTMLSFKKFKNLKKYIFFNKNVVF